MDEAEKYQQRLEAIVEKRRLQEEQDRARREMDDEKLRLQQLKRKSLRDQWLMEGAPLSPTALESPRSPLWGSQAQEIEKRIDKLQEESHRLAEEEEKLKEQMEDGQTEAVTEAGVEIVQDAVVQNGANNVTVSETTEEEEVKTNQTPLLEETTTVMTNGREDPDANINHDAAEEIPQSTTNGPTDSGVSIQLEPGLSPEVSEPELGRVPHFNIHDEEEGTLVMRAERVIITDEGDDVSEDLIPQEDQQEITHLQEPPLPNPEADPEGTEAAEEVIKPDAAPEMFTESENRLTPEPQPATGDADLENENGDVETKAEAEDNQTEAPVSVQPLSPANALEGTAVAVVPVYSEAEPYTLTTELAGVEGETAVAPEGAEAPLEAQDPAAMPGQFQEVPLADPQEKQRTEAEPGEQEPLLSQTKAPNTQAEPAVAAAATSSPTSTETHTPTRANQGEETAAPKHKTCQCCSVM